MNTPSVKFRRAKETSFLICDAIIFDLFSPFALKVYGQLRKLTSYNQECDEIEITVKNLATLSGISERKTYDVLNELEHTHYIIQRTNLYHFRYGQVNSFTVSQTHNFFKPAQDETTTAPDAEGVDNSGQNLSPPAFGAVPSAQYAGGTAPNADLLIEQDLSQKVSKKKQNTRPVFSDNESVKNHITLVIANRGAYVEDDVLDQIIFYIGDDKAYNSVVKKINIALKKVREGKWNIPNGYKGITSKSIRENEERQQEAKRAQYQQDAVIMQTITQSTAQGTGLKSFSDMFKKLKDDMDAKANEGAMPEKTVSARRKARG